MEQPQMRTKSPSIRSRIPLNPVLLGDKPFMEYKTYLTINTDTIEPTEALEKIREIEGVDIETSM